MGVDGLCSDYPERVHEANRKFRPQATQTDAATFPFPQGPDSSSGVDLRGLVTTDSVDESDATESRADEVGSGIGTSSSSKAAEGATDSTALGGWYSRCDTCEKSAENSELNRLMAALYGDLAGVRDFAVGAVEESKMLAKVTSKAAAVREFLSADAMRGTPASSELRTVLALCKEAESEAEQALRPFVSSAETFRWSVDLISTEKVRGARGGVTAWDPHDRFRLGRSV